MKRLIGIVLLLFAAAGFFIAARDVWDMHGGHVGTVTAGQETEKNQPDQNCSIEIFFFYGTAECPTCDIIKEETTEVINKLQEGDFEGPMPEIHWTEINVEEPGNEEYILDYGLYTTTVVLADHRDPERWKRLDQVWDMASDRNRLADFIKDQILQFAKGCQS
jgi:hypothetical protein